MPDNRSRVHHESDPRVPGPHAPVGVLEDQEEAFIEQADSAPGRSAGDKATSSECQRVDQVAARCLRLRIQMLDSASGPIQHGAAEPGDVGSVEITDVWRHRNPPRRDKSNERLPEAGVHLGIVVQDTNHVGSRVQSHLDTNVVPAGVAEIGTYFDNLGPGVVLLHCLDGAVGRAIVNNQHRRVGETSFLETVQQLQRRRARST